MKIGDRVRINFPNEPRVHGYKGIIAHVYRGSHNSDTLYSIDMEDVKFTVQDAEEKDLVPLQAIAHGWVLPGVKR